MKIKRHPPPAASFFLNSANSIFGLIAVIFLVGCNKWSVSSSSDFAVINGNAMFGAVQGATVKLHPVLSSGTIDTSSTIDSATTDSIGNYTLTISKAKLSSGPIGVQLTGGKYIEEVSGGTISIGTNVFSSILPSIDPGVVTNIAVGPLTNMAYQVYLSKLTSSSYSSTALATLATNANYQVSQAFGISDVIGTIPDSPTGSVTNTAAGQYTVVLVAISKLANTNNTDSTAIASAYTKYLINNSGDLTGVGTAAISVVDAAGATKSVNPISMGSLSELTTQIGTGGILVTGLTPSTSFQGPVFNSTPSSTAPSGYVVGTPGTTATTVPAPPTGVTAVKAGPTSATIAFTAPTKNGGSAITGYTITPYIGTSAGTPAHGSSPLVISGLVAGSTYTFTVKATNTIGSSAESTASNSLALATVPGAPTGATFIQSSSLTTAGNVTFLAPSSNGGSSITGYVVTSNPAGGVDSNPGSTTLVHTMTGLTTGGTYTFSVVASNIVGAGTASLASASVILKTAPGAPTIGTVSADNLTATVDIFPPVTDGSSAITGYTVTATNASTNTSAGADANAGGTGLSHSITGLTNSTPYTFTAIATNAYGNSLPSEASYAVAPFNLSTLTSLTTANARKCAICHGPTGVSISSTYPNLATQGSAYLLTKGTGFQALPTTSTGTTTNFLKTSVAEENYMYSLITTLSFADIEQIAGYFSGQQASVANPVTFGTVSAGSTTFGSCVACHGSFGQGGMGPRLAGQKPIFVREALGDFAAGQARANAPMMPGIVPGLNASNIENVAAYVSTLAPPDAPVSLVVSGSTATTADITFTPPASTAGTILNYQTTVFVGGVTMGTVTTGPAFPITVTGLSTATTYTFTVNATNAAGTGSNSTATSPMTTP